MILPNLQRTISEGISTFASMRLIERLRNFRLGSQSKVGEQRASLWGTMPLLLVWRVGLVLLIYTLCRLIFWQYNTDLLGFSGWQAVKLALRGGLVFDLSAALYINLIVLVLHLLPTPYKYHPRYLRVCNLTYWLCNIPAFIFNLGDTIYYRFTGKRTTLDVFAEFQNENPLNFLRFFGDYWHLTLIGIALIALWLWLYHLAKPNTAPLYRAWGFYLSSVFALIASAVLAAFGIRGSLDLKDRPLTPNKAHFYIEKPAQRAMVLNTPFVMIRLVHKARMPEFRYFDNHEQIYSARQEHIAPSEWRGKFRGRNVVVIIWESLAKEWVGALNRHIPGYKGFTPFLDSLMAESYVFERAYATGPQSIDAMPALYASLTRPIEAFAHSHYSGNKLRALPAVLASEGYDTRFYHNATNGSMGFDAMARQLGFAGYRGRTEYGKDEDFDGTWGIFDEPFLQYVAGDISTLREPFFVSEFTTTSHSPYIIPKAYEARFPKGRHEQHHCMPYTDHALRQFFDTAKTKPWYNNTLFVIVADHAVPGDLAYYKNANGLFSIPMILYDPQGKLRGWEAERVVGQADLYPTLLDLLGIQQTIISFGNNMLAKEGEHFAVCRIDGGYQFVRGDYALHYDGEQVLGLYHVKDDPEFKHNIQNSAPEVLADMLRLFQAYLQDFSQRMRENRLVP